MLKLRSHPVQIIRAGESIVLKRGCTEIHFRGAKYANRLVKLLELCSVGSTEQEILARFEQDDREEIRDLIGCLIGKHIFVPVNGTMQEQPQTESPSDIFFWQFEPRDQPIVRKLQSRRIVLLGSNVLSVELAGALAVSGFANVTTVDYPTNGTTEVDWKTTDCLVATSDHGGRELLRQWNELAIQHHCHFLPVILQDLIGYIGPFVIPEETACYECLVARENSHLDDHLVRRTIERSAREGRHIAGYHPLMISVLAGVAAFELMKIYGELAAIRNVGVLVEVNLLSTKISTRKVLKVPRCLMCSGLMSQPSISIHAPIIKSGTEHT